MRRIAAFLLLAAGTGLVFETELTRADEEENQPVTDQVEKPDDGEKPPREKARRGGRHRGGPAGEDGVGRRGRSPRHHGPPPVIAALDTDKDGVISSTEISGAASALKTLDENGDGELTEDELRPACPACPAGPGGPRGRGFGRRGPSGPDGERDPRRRGRPGRDGDRGERPSPEQMVERIMQADEDGDGKISKDEAPERMARNFDRIDANGDGFIDRTELEEAAKRFGRGRGGRGRGAGPDGDKPRGPRPPLDDSDEGTEA